MDYKKYELKINKPNRPIKPLEPTKNRFKNTLEFSIAHDKYIDDLSKYKEDKQLYDKLELDYAEELCKLMDMFKRDAIIEVGLDGHPKANDAYDLAYKYGNDSGHKEIYCYLFELANLLLSSK